MSHQPLRTEKNCLNCGTEVFGRFCHVCGQENVVTHQNFWSLTKHFIFDIFHFDGKFFHTVGYLFSRPGFVARQYVEGKRMRFLDPIRMYLFTSAVFFFIFFYLNPVHVGGIGYLSRTERKELTEQYEKRLERNANDTMLQRRIALLRDTTIPINIDSLGWRESLVTFDAQEERYLSAAHYDSIQHALPEGKRDAWLEQVFTRQLLNARQKHGGTKEASTSLVETFLHKLPYLLFISLPFFALILKGLYRRRGNYFYSDHAVFTLYHFILSFLIILLFLGMGVVYGLTRWPIVRWLVMLVYFAWPVYLLLEMKHFYRQGWGKTVGKFVLLMVAGFLVLILLFMLFLILSIFQV